MHVSLHADPDALKARSSAESIPGTASAHQDEPSRTQDESENHLNESTFSAQSVTSNASSSAVSVQSTSRVSCNSSLVDDSPDTSKIKNIVDKQIEKYFGPDVLQPHVAKESSFSFLSNLQLPSSSAPARGVDPQAVHQWYHRADHLSALATSAPAVPPAPVKPPSEAELFRANLSKVQALLPTSLGITNARRRQPGWQGRFLDKETDRASNIMNGVSSKSDHV